MGCPFGFQQPRTNRKPLEPLFFELKNKAQEIAFQIMEETGLTHLQMRDVALATLLNFRVDNEEECKKSVQMLYKKCYGQFTRMLVAFQNLEEYMNSVFNNDEDDDEPTVYYTVCSLFGYTTFHDQERFLSMISE